MSLPAPFAQISIGDIRTELSNTGTAPFSLAKAGMGYTATRGDGYTPINQISTSKPNTSSLYSISEWYSYNHSQNGFCGSSYTTPSIDGKYLYYRINVTGSAGNTSSISATMSSITVGDTINFNIYSTYPFTNTGTLSGGVLLSTLSFTTNTTLTYTYTLTSTSDILYIVIWDTSIL